MGAPKKYPTAWAMPHPATVGWMRQFRYMAWLYERIRGLHGDVVECGLGEGNTFAMLAYLVGSERPLARTLWGCDSFQGWPEPTPWDASPRDPKKGEWAIPEEDVRQRLAEAKIGDAFPGLDIRMVPGFFDATLPNFPADRPIAFLHLDCDLYPGYHDALTNLFPRMVPGGVVLLDEYREFPRRPEFGDGTVEKWPGCTKAVDDYLADRSERPEFHAETGKYFIVKAA